MTEPASDRGRLRIAAIAALAVVVAAYSNHFPNGFHFDDAHVIENNLYLRSLANLPRFFVDASTFSSYPPNATYRPLVSATLAVDYALGGGLDPAVFHATQFVLHLLVALGAFLLFRATFSRAGAEALASWLALGGATWFAVHTANTETVNYLSARSDILSTLGVLGAFLLYLRGGRARRRHLYLIPMVVGALAKPTALVFAPLLLAWVLLFDEEEPLGRVLRHPRRGPMGRAARRAAPAMLTAVATFAFLEWMNPPSQTYGGGSLPGYLLTQAWVWVHYLRLFLLPIGLTADTDLGLLAPWYDTRVLVGLAFVALLAVAAVGASAWRRGRPVAFGLIWFAFGLAPTSSFVPLAEVANEHRLYLPYLGLVLAGMWGLGLIAIESLQGTEAGQPSGPERTRAGGDRPPLRPRRAALLASGLGLLVLAHAVGTHLRNEVWRTEETLWADVVEKSPENGRAWMNYGLTQMEAGRLERADDLFRHAATLAQDYPHLETNRGIVSAALGRRDDAEKHFRRALELDSRFVEGYYYFARWLVGEGRAPEALPLLEQGVALSPGHPAAVGLREDLHRALGRDPGASPSATDEQPAPPEERRSPAEGTALPLERPADPAQALFEEGLALTGAEQHLEAALRYREALRRRPSADAFNNLGWSLLKLGFEEGAAEAFRQALELEPDHANAAGNLAWMFSRQEGPGS